MINVYGRSFRKSQFEFKVLQLDGTGRHSGFDFKWFLPKNQCHSGYHTTQDIQRWGGIEYHYGKGKTLNRHARVYLVEIVGSQPYRMRRAKRVSRSFRFIRRIRSLSEIA